MQRRYDEGTRAEDAILRQIEHEFSGQIRYRQTQYEVEVGTLAVVRGHVDGVFMGHLLDVEMPVIDAKFLGEQMYEKWDRLWDDADMENWCAAFPYYAWQMSAYMIGARKPGAFLVAVKEDQPEGDPKVKKIEVFTVQKPFYGKAHIVKRVANLLSLVNKDMPACDIDMFPCPFYYIHDEKETVVHDDTLLGMMAEQYEKGATLEREGFEMKKKAREYIFEVLDRDGLKGERITAHDEEDKGWEINDVIQHRTRFDVDSARKAGIDVDSYMVEFDTRYPKVKKL
jgi:hypothetical protein